LSWWTRRGHRGDSEELGCEIVLEGDDLGGDPTQIGLTTEEGEITPNTSPVGPGDDTI